MITASRITCLEKWMPSRLAILVPAFCVCLLAAFTLPSLRHFGMGAGHSSNVGDGTGAAAPQPATLPEPEKLGAGLLLTCGGEVLLLRRAGRHNFGTWGLPGGNADAGDADLLATARREAEEEMGPGVPPFNILAQALTVRGKRGQKHYTVFVARISPEDRATWQPQLNEEHSAWRWFSLAELQAANAPLHPVVQLALQTPPNRSVVLAAIAGSAGGSGSAAQSSAAAKPVAAMHTAGPVP